MEPLVENFEELKISSSFKTGLVYNEQMLLHSPAPKKHYETPARLEAILSHLTTKSILKNPNLDFVEHVNPALDSCINACHPPNYIEYVAEMFPEESERKSIFIFDSYYNKHTNLSARIAVSCLNLCVDKIMNHEWKNGYALVRPPGHHSGHHTTINGFCVFNNVAIAAKYAQRVYNVKKILIFDWDVHHGDGTEHIFYKDPSVLFASIHRYENGNFYPNHGSSDRIGEGDGKGYNINIGWNTGTEDDTVTTDDYIYVFERVLLPIFKDFKPDLIFVSAGFDSCKGDPLGLIDLTPDGYAYMLRKLQGLAGGRIILALEGGYNTKSISNCSETVIRVLLNEPIPLICQENKMGLEEMLLTCKPNDISLKAAEIVMKHHKEKWGAVIETKELRNFQQIMEMTNYFAVERKKNIIINDDKFLKKACENEKIFYSNMDKELESFLSKFYGVEIVNEVEYIKLENLFHDKWKKMSFLEVKLGKKTYNRNDENEKKNEKKDQMSTSSTLGFRITNAFIIKKNSEAIKIKKGEAFSHLSKKENSEQLIKDFIFEESGNEEDRKQAGKYFLQGFEKMVTWFKGNQSSEKFISVSLMFFLHYEEKFWDLKLVDFASKHKEEKETKDNLIDGLRNLYKIFKELLD